MYRLKLNRPLTLLTAFGALALSAIPAASNAAQLPSYASHDRSETIHGTISSVPGKYDLYLRDDRGFTDHVVLHDGTAIFPTGLQLGSGETVTISGHNAGNVFAADSIDTPYAAADGDGGYADPGYAYDDAAYAGGYPYYYGYPYYGGYYPYASVGFYFGGGYYGHGYYGHGYRGHGGYYGHGYGGHGGYYGHGSYGRGSGSYGGRGFSGGARGFSGGGGRGFSGGGARGFSGGGGRGFSGGGGHGGGGHR